MSVYRLPRFLTCSCCHAASTLKALSNVSQLCSMVIVNWFSVSISSCLLVTRSLIPWMELLMPAQQRLQQLNLRSFLAQLQHPNQRSNSIMLWNMWPKSRLENIVLSIELPYIFVFYTCCRCLVLLLLFFLQQRFEQKPEVYEDFLEILHAYQEKRSTDGAIDQVKAQVQHLFRGHPDLLDDFNYFLPPESGAWPPKKTTKTRKKRATEKVKVSCFHRSPIYVHGFISSWWFTWRFRFASLPKKSDSQRRQVVAVRHRVPQLVERQIKQLANRAHCLSHQMRRRNCNCLRRSRVGLPRLCMFSFCGAWTSTIVTSSRERNWWSWLKICSTASLNTQTLLRRSRIWLATMSGKRTSSWRICDPTFMHSCRRLISRRANRLRRVIESCRKKCLFHHAPAERFWVMLFWMTHVSPSPQELKIKVSRAPERISMKKHSSKSKMNDMRYGIYSRSLCRCAWSQFSGSCLWFGVVGYDDWKQRCCHSSIATCGRQNRNIDLWSGVSLSIWSQHWRSSYSCNVSVVWRSMVRHCPVTETESRHCRKFCHRNL